MSSSVLDFFILEAGEYVEQLDGLFASAGAHAPDADAVQRAARALRGSATMARLPAFAELAHALERTGRALREGSLRWDAHLRGAALSAVDEAKILLHAARTWTDEESRRAHARAQELSALLPAAAAAPATPATPNAALGFVAGEAANVAAGLELLLTRPDADAAGMVLQRVRALRGLAAVKDVPLVAQVLEAAEQAAAPLEQGRASVSEPQRELLHAAASVLRSSAGALRAGQPVDPSGDEARRFGDATDAWFDSASEAERVVPIASLFPDDGGTHVVQAAASPPTTANERFRLELVSQGEHLRGLVDEARGASDDAAHERYRRELRRALRGVQGVAESFDGREVATLAATALAARALDGDALDRLARLAGLLADPALSHEVLSRRLAELDAPAAATPAPVPVMPNVVEGAPTAAESPVAATPTPTSTPMRDPEAPTPVVALPAVERQPEVERVEEPAPAAAAADRLEAGLAGLERLELEPLAAPVAVESPVVPVEMLVYRGRAAVRRAIEIRDDVRRSGAVPTRETLEELFDLLDLALLDEAAA